MLLEDSAVLPDDFRYSASVSVAARSTYSNSITERAVAPSVTSRSENSGPTRSPGVQIRYHERSRAYSILEQKLTLFLIDSRPRSVIANKSKADYEYADDVFEEETTTKPPLQIEPPPRHKAAHTALHEAKVSQSHGEINSDTKKDERRKQLLIEQKKKWALANKEKKLQEAQKKKDREDRLLAIASKQREHV